MTKEQLKVAVVQMSSIPGEVKKNREIIANYTAEASKQEVDIVITPELSNTGYDLSILDKINYNFQEEIEYYSALSKHHNINLACGMLEVENGTFFNSVICFGTTGEILAKYRKINLFRKENDVFQKGNSAEILTLGDFKIGLSICYDIRFPELYRKLLNMGCNVILVSSAFPFPRLDHWKTLIKAQAILNQTYLLASNRVGTDNSIQFLGNSCIIDPWGTILSSCDETEEGLNIETLELSKIAEVRNKISAVNDRINSTIL